MNKMDESDLDNITTSCLFSRYRSPSFQQAEVKALLKFVEKNKYVLLNKSVNTAANNAKDKVWATVTTKFNKLGLGPKRTMDALRTKWENLKRNARRIAKDVMDDDGDFTNDEIKKTITIICAAENTEYDEQNGTTNSFEDGTDFTPWASDEDENFVHDGDIEKDTAAIRLRSSMFHHAEVKALLKLIEKNKQILMNKSTNAASNHAKEKGWAMVATELNKLGLGPKRTGEVLKTKWENLKRKSKKIAKEVVDDDCGFSNDEMKKTIMMICAAENIEYDEQNFSIINFEDEGTDMEPWASDEDVHSAAYAHGGDMEKETSANRFRSPTFQQAEVKALLKLIEKYKYVLMNRSTNSATNNAKDKTWATIATKFNKLRVGPKRSVDVLRTKWENLKRKAKKVTKDVMEDDCGFIDNEMKKTINIVCSTENIEYDEQNCVPSGSEDDRTDFEPWASDEDDNSAAFTLGGEVEKKPSKKCYERTGFSPQDCRILLQCVRQEKRILFSKNTNSKRRAAWERIAESYNNQTPRKKTPKELNRKFNNMKAMARKVNFKGLFKNKKRKKYEQLDDDKMAFTVKVKSEPIVNLPGDDFDFISDDEQVTSNPGDNFSADSRRLSFTQDPLNNAHGSDSGLGTISEIKDIPRLKLELLNYKMETARLERKRIEDAIKAEEKERELRAAELALRVRAARLSAAAAAATLPPAHPALQLTPEELRAMQLCGTHLDIG